MKRNGGYPSENQGEQYHNTRNTIIDSAARLFNQQGYHRTTMREIAMSVGLTIGTIYHYVGGKEELLFEVCNRIMNYALNFIEDGVDVNASAEANIRTFIERHLRATVSHRDAISVFLKEHKNLSKDLLSDILLVRAKHQNVVESLIADGVKRGEFKNMNPRMAAFCLFGMCNWATYWYKEDGPLSIDDIIDEFSEIFINGVASCEKANDVLSNKSNTASMVKAR